MPGALVAERIGLGKTSTSVAAAMIRKFVMQNVVIELLLSIMCGNTSQGKVNMEQNDYLGIIGKEWECYLLLRPNSVAHCLLEIQATSPHCYPAPRSAPKLILVVTMPGVAETIRSVIDKMIYWTDFKLLNWLHAENLNHTHQDLIPSIDKPETHRKFHLVSYHTLICRVKPSTNGQFSYCAWSVTIFMSSISTRLKTVWPGKLWWKWPLDSNFKSQLQQDSIHSITGVFRQCGCCLVCLKIQRMIQ